jgi:predicted DCC family thiol-disulfide oxidoreductase YuxK
MQTQKSIVFFDGLCHLCNGFVDAVIQRDLEHRFQFAPIQGETAQKVLTPEERSKLETVILVVGDQHFQRSEAVLRILIGLGGGYRFFLAGFLLPAFLRDQVYGLVAGKRYAWFGQREFCRLPRPDEKEYLLP